MYNNYLQRGLIMKVLKIENGHKINEMVLINNSTTRLSIRYSENGDLCFSVGNGILLKKTENDTRIFEVSNSDKAAYAVFDKLYNSLLSLKDENKDLFDKDDNFIWISDKKQKESDYLVISHDLESYKFIFVRNNSHKELVKKTIRSINIEFSNSKNNDVVRCFYEMCKGLKKIGTTELLFTRKEDKNE